MRKLKLNKLSIVDKDILAKNELKTIFGGYGGLYCRNDNWCPEGCMQRVDPNSQVWTCSYCCIV